MTRARPLLAHVARLRKRPGSREPFRADVAFDDLAITSARVPGSEPVGVDLTLESIAEGVVASGNVTFAWEGECRRCLRTLRGTTSAAVREIFEADPVEGETWPLGSDSIDLEPVVREAVLVNLPLAPLCDENCLGPAPDQFPTTVEGDGDAAAGTGDHPAKDPRWAALDALEFDQ